MITELDVYLNRELSGRLFLDANHNMEFVYSDKASHPISVGMPIESKSFGNDDCEAFFGGLLPESDIARKALGKRFGISAFNTFSLLRAIGAECAGALSIIESGTEHPADNWELLRNFSEHELAQHIRELPHRPLFVGVNGIKLSLAGVQDKAAVVVTPDGIGIPAGGPTTHILKPDLKHAPGAIYSEYLLLRTAASKNIGIEVPQVELGKAEDQVYLLVQRYDRHRKRAQEIPLRLHQEDFCQALKIPSTRKYEDEGGPSLRDCFQLLQKTVVPARDRLRLLKLVIFNFLVGNMDAHGKNFSLLHTPKGLALAPLYDVVCTRAFPKYSQRLAMRIGDYFEPEEIYAHHWRTFCEDVEYSFPAFKRVAKDLYRSLPIEAEQTYEEMVATGWAHPVCETAVDIIKSNCTEMERRLTT